MTTECTQIHLEFHGLNGRQVRAQFDGGAISSDGGGLLLREVEKRVGVIGQFAACFTDHRRGERIEHRLEELVAQRVYGLALGYEDLNDHEELRHDPLLAVLVEKGDASRERLAGKKHVEPAGTDGSPGGGPGTLQKDRVGSWGGGSDIGGSVSASARAS